MESNYTPKDFSSDQEVKWCPGCGDYSVLKQIQNILPNVGIKKEDIVFISGIGCSSRLVYYMNTYGMHGIHGRATTIASGVKLSNPKLSVWVVSGDGDSFSIGGNHLIHLARRNTNLNVVILNNEIYGLTKGQFSPTSKLNQKTKSSPFGVKSTPFNPSQLLLGAGASFIARTMDVDIKNQKEILLKSEKHKGASFVEIYQNCNIFNDKAFNIFKEKESKEDKAIFLKEGEPIIFGKEKDKAIILENYTPKIVNLKDTSEKKLWIHNPKDKMKAFILSNFGEEFPKPFGIFYTEERKTNESHSEKKLDINSILKGDKYWEVK